MEKGTENAVTIVILLGAAAAAGYIITRPTPQPLTPIGAAKKIGAAASGYIQGIGKAAASVGSSIGSTIKGWF